MTAQQFRLEDILPIIGGRLICGNARARLSTFAIDSRFAGPEVLFIPLMGQSRDGHQYVPDALAKGCAGALVRSGHQRVHEICGWVRERYRGHDADAPAVIEVKHTLVALQRLAEWQRRQSAARIAAITGSVGKTGTKEILVQLLAPDHRVISTEKNFNNEIGVPLALGRLAADTQVGVIEMAMRARGEISLLSRLAAPDVALITSVAGSHVGRLGSFDEVLRAKAEIVDGLQPGGTLLLNARAPAAAGLAAEVRRRIRDKPVKLAYFNTDAAYASAGVPPFAPFLESLDRGGADSPAVWIEDFDMLGLEGSRFTLCSADERAAVELGLLGRSAAENFAAAAALALELGQPLTRSAELAPGLLPAPQRLNLYRPREGVVVIDDCYNSSPGSAADSLDLLLSVDPRYRKVLVLGDMLELGKYETLLHRSLAQRALSLPLQSLYAIGPRMNAVNEVDMPERVELHYADGTAGSRGSDENSVFVEDAAVERIAGQVCAEIAQADEPVAVLIKGARGLHLERVVSAVLEQVAAA